MLARLMIACVLMLSMATPADAEIEFESAFWQVIASASCGPPNDDVITSGSDYYASFAETTAGISDSAAAACGGGTGQSSQDGLITIDPVSGAWHVQVSGFAQATGFGGPTIAGGAGGDAEFIPFFFVHDESVEVTINSYLEAEANGEALGIAFYRLEPQDAPHNFIAAHEVAFTASQNGSDAQSHTETVTLEPGLYSFWVSVGASGGSDGGSAHALANIDFHIGAGGNEPEPPDDCEAINWTGAADSGGVSKLFAEDENWSVGQPPQENHIARFTAAAIVDDDTDFDLAFPGAGNTTNAAIVVRAAQPDIDLATGTYTLTGDCPGVDSIQVGVDGALLSDLLFKNGTVLADNITVGKLDGENGFLNVISQGAITADGLVTIGDQGKGNLLVQVGGVFEAAEVTLGQDTTGIGKAFVTEPGSDMTIDPGGTLTLGFRGYGELLVGNQAKLDDFGDLLLAEQAGSVGLATITGGGTATIEGLTVIGKNGLSFVDIDSNGSMTCQGVTSLSVGEAAQSVVAVKDGGSLTTHDAFNIGYGGDGELNIFGVGSGVNSKEATLGTTPTGKGEVSITGGAVWIVQDSVHVGAAGPGVVSVDATSTLQAQLLGVTSVGTLDATVIHIGAGTNANAKDKYAAVAAALPGPGVFVETLVVEPGATLNVGQVAFDERGVIEIEIGGPTAGVDFQVMAIAGAADLSGTLRVKLVNDYIPAYGQRFDVMSYASYAGAFTAIEGPEGYPFLAEYGPNSLTLVSTAGDPFVGQSNLCGVACGPMGLMPMCLTMLSFCGLRRMKRSQKGSTATPRTTD